MNNDIESVDHSTVKLYQSNADDLTVARAAWVSQSPEADEREAEPGRVEGLIRYLMRNQHMSCFEHCHMTFVIDTPIFVARQIMRHRSSAFNEWSARYSEMRPRFYAPYTNGRPLVQSGKIGHYTFEQGSFHQGEHVDEAIEEVSKTAWGCYEDMLSDGIAKEVARMVLPVNTMTTFWMTTNVRNLLHFLDLRNDDHAQYEVREVARQMEDLLASEMPMTYAAYRQINTKEEA